MSKVVVPRQIGVHKLVEVFLSGKNQNTLEAYRRDLGDFKVFLNSDTITAAISELLARGAGNANLIALEYQAHLLARKLQGASVNRKLAALRSVVRLARTLGITNYTLEVPSLKVTPYRDTRGLGRKGVDEILELVGERDNDKAIRDRAIVFLLYGLALRVSEIVNLDMDDLDLGAKTVAVKGKGKIDKIKLDIPPKTLAALKAWVAVRGSLPGPLLLNCERAKKRRKRISRQGVRYVVKYYGLKLGIKNSHPHSFRHTSLSTALGESQRAGFRPDETLQFSRHSSLKNLEPYLDKERDVQGRLAKLVEATVEVGKDDE
jgi:integrase/recombinase XerC